MKTLRFKFPHPFKSQAIRKLIGSANASHKRFLLGSKESNIVKIPLNNFQKGNYEMKLDREVIQYSFIYQQTVEIKGQPNLIPGIT